MTLAAERRIKFSSILPWFALAKGAYGFTVNKPDAIEWLKNSLDDDCRFHTLMNQGKGSKVFGRIDRRRVMLLVVHFRNGRIRFSTRRDATCIPTIKTFTREFVPPENNNRTR